MSVFTGDINKLVAAAMLQDFLIDKDGTPMSGGTITMYHDNSRTTLKNWYYQSGTPGNYTYITLPNPLTLSAAGTITDINGVDTIPFYYPWSETDETVHDPYYVTIVNHAQTNQITRANFPFEGMGGGGGTTVDTFNNLIINGGFWRNVSPNTLNVTPFTTITYDASNNMSSPATGPAYSTIVAPSQHDGFRMPDTQFIKNNLTATDKATFTPFPLSSSLVIANDIVPEYYVNHTCQSPAGSGETQKCYQFPISLHVNTLANVVFSFSIQAQNDPIGGSTSFGANVIKLFILQDTGTGGTPSPSSVSPVSIGEFTLNSSWTTYTGSSTFPSTTGLVLGNGADDGLYLQVQMPLNLACSINFTKPGIYLTNNVLPNNEFQTYDQVDSIINSPRTGDLRTSLNSFYYFGWLPMNDGSIGTSTSGSTARANADTWPLFNLIWNAAAPYSASGGGTTNPLAQMYDSSGVAVGYGPNITSPTTAYSDFNANRRLSLSKMMGNVMLGTVPLAALLTATSTLTGFKSVVTASSSTGLLFTTATANLLNIFLGNTVTFTSTTSLVNVAANTVYYMVPVAGSTTTFKIATSFANALAGTVVTFTGAETGTVTAYLQLTASVEGEYAHTQLLNELKGHTHDPSIGSAYWMVAGAASVQGGATETLSGAATTGNVTGLTTQRPFNVTQPGTFYNIFIKL